MRTLSVAGLIAATLVVSSGRASAQTTPGAPQSPGGEPIYRTRCASCHDAADASRTPSRESLKSRSVPIIVAALSPGGVMADVGKELSTAEKQAVAVYLSATPTPSATASATPSAAGTPSAAAAADPSVGRCAAGVGPMRDPSSGPSWNGWGNDPTNGRFQPASGAGLTAANVPKLTLKWAFAFEGATSGSGQPTVAGGRVFVGNENGMFYALDAASGCLHWSYKVGSGVRTAPSVGRVTGANGPVTAVFFGDLKANVVALDASTGAEIWKTNLDTHPFARITGAPTLEAGRLYVPVSSFEEVAGGRANYACCTFQGSVAAIDAGTGKVVWHTSMIPDKPQIAGKNSAGTPQWKSAGAAVWTAPTIDRAKGIVYVGTGNAYTEPAAPNSDSVVALDMKTGAILWANQITPSDVFVIGCGPGNTNCAAEVGPDHDFGNSPILRTLPNGKRVLLAGQKSGTMYGLDPDNKGAVLWRFRAGKGGALGGIEWGSAADDRNVYVPVSDVLLSAAEAGGLFAINIADGTQAWHAAPPALTCKGGQGCTSAQSAAISVIPGVVFSGSVDGHLRAFSTADGKIVWDFDTIREFETVNGVKGSGGSIDSAGPVIAGGLVLTNSGYGRWRGKPGNVLLAFEVK